MRNAALLTINGRRHDIAGDSAMMPLSDYLRHTLRLTGAKIVCAEGDCGACTVLVARCSDSPNPEFIPVNACITTPALHDCSHILTVEALQEKEIPHPVQTAMIKNHGAQCGFCTPGIVCALAGLFERTNEITEQRAKNALTGNLCRCTGYEPILKAAMDTGGNLIGTLARRYLSPPAQIAELRNRANDNLFVRPKGSKLYFLPDTSTPCPLVKSKALTPSYSSYFAPVLLGWLLQYKRDHPDARLISAATDIGVAANKREGWRQKFCSLARVPECLELARDGDGVRVGAGVTLARLQDFAESRYPEFHRLLNVFASPQIRNVATLVGNIANASPIADTLPFLFIMGAELEIRSHARTRRVNINDFYRGYKQMDIQTDEVITAVRIPELRQDERIKLYKVSRREDMDIACVTAGYRFRLKGRTVLSARIAYGGVGPVVMRLPKTEEFLRGRDCELATMEDAGTLAQTEVNPIDDVRGSREYRLKLVKNLFLKLHDDLNAGA